jgi:hypothetical protein
MQRSNFTDSLIMAALKQVDADLACQMHAVNWILVPLLF